MRVPRIALSSFLLLMSCFGLMAAVPGQPRDGSAMHSNMPAGYEVVFLKPSRTSLALMGLIECPELEGAQRVSVGIRGRLVSADGEPIKRFPQRFSFRITASLRKVVLDGAIASIDVPDEPHELLLKLKFRVRAYNGLEVQEIFPESIEMIGVPADVPSDERVYRVNLNNVSLPITDRLVVEILSPQGQVLTHFPFSPL
jgi:hypothetical protein